MVRMGVHAAVSKRRPMGGSTVVYQAVNSAGNTFEYEVTETAELVLDLTHFVDLDDGHRVSIGDITLELGEVGLEELREELRETIFEDDIREIDVDEPRWEDLIESLGRAGVAADEAALEALPFVIELDDAVLQRVTR
jgi:hypothetical protein